MQARAREYVPLPNASPTISYWQDPPSDIANLRTTNVLPDKVDVVIIGSGISGSSIAYHLLSQHKDKNVVMLEARQACSGATGRNGGHTKAASYRSFIDHERELGLPEAVKIAQMEYANIRDTHAFAREHGIDCASTECDTVDIIFSEQQRDLSNRAVRRMKQAMGDDPAAVYQQWNSEETERKFLIPNALGSLQYAAGSLSAYALTIGVLKLALNMGLNLQTGTAVESIEQVNVGVDGTTTWSVATKRGTIRADQVVIATNGYTPHLIPSMQGIIVPLHGQVLAQRPGSTVPQTGLPVTYSFIYNDGYEYMITRPPGSLGEGDIIIGGGLHQLPNAGVSRYGNTDDSAIDATISTYLHGCNERTFGKHWGKPADHLKEWSGVMGASADGLPYVGEVPDMPGAWLSASFNGHGMVLCWKAAEALINMMFGSDAVKTNTTAWFPQSMLITKERMAARFTGRKDLVAGEAQFGERET